VAEETRQVDVEPGKTKVLGPFLDKDAHEVTLKARVRACDEEGGIERRLEGAVWEIVLPPDSVVEVAGLIEDGTTLVVAVISSGCADPDATAAKTPKPRKDNSGVLADSSGVQAQVTPEIFRDRPGVEAEVAPEEIDG
jgi:hypothetical protein